MTIYPDPAVTDGAGLPVAAPAAPASVAAPRSLGLDALRGLAIVLMVVSSVTPRSLPNWMYHGNDPQFAPAPAEPTPGGGAAASAVRWVAVAEPWGDDPAWVAMTWVDVVFPMFLFAMGAAIPLALDARLRRDPSRPAQAGVALRRFGWLVAFAVYVQQTQVWAAPGGATPAALGLSLLAFVVLFGVFAALPRDTPPAARRLARGVGVASGALVLFVMHARPGSAAFSWGDNDVIILLLAWSGLAASLLWLAAPGRPWARLAVGLAVAFLAHEVNLPPEHRLPTPGLWAGVESVADAPRRLLDLGWLLGRGAGGATPGWADLSPLYAFGYLGCLWLVVPGVAVGDLMVRRRTAAIDVEDVADDGLDAGTRAGRRWGWLPCLASLGVAAVVILAGLQDVIGRWSIAGVGLRNPYNAALAAPLLWLAAWLAPRGHATDPASEAESAAVARWVVRGVAVAGTLGLLLACLPGRGGGLFEGGPRKVPGTLSWYLLSLALTGSALAALSVLTDLRGHRRLAAPLIDVGRNPLLAYAAARGLMTFALLMPLIPRVGGAASVDDRARAGLDALLGPGHSPWWSLAYGFCQVAALAAVTMAFTSARIVWRT